MKMIKAMKKLKFWSRKKKKKLIKTPFIDHIPPPPPRRPPPPPPPCRHCYFPYHPVEPSAPPLPPGVDFGTFEEETHDTILLAEEDISIITDPTSTTSGGTRNIAHPGQTSQTTSQDDDDPTSPPPTKITDSYYQKYMDPNPVYGVPATAGPVIRSERGAGGFGCVIDIGFHLFRCFFPCFHIREFK